MLKMILVLSTLPHLLPKHKSVILKITIQRSKQLDMILKKITSALDIIDQICDCLRGCFRLNLIGYHRIKKLSLR